MLKVISAESKLGNDKISILYPGIALAQNDTGIGSIGRIDHATINSETTIKMHPHENDEILSYFRDGKVFHIDSNQNKEVLNRSKIMLMKSGKVFFHEEKIVQKLEGLQIFIRPAYQDYSAKVLFRYLEESDSYNRWRLIAKKGEQDDFAFSSQTEIFDLTITSSNEFSFPNTKLENHIFILYVYQGSISINGNIKLNKGDSLVTDENETFFSSKGNAEILLLITNPTQDCFKQGMYSGNKI